MKGIGRAKFCPAIFSPGSDGVWGEAPSGECGSTDGLAVVDRSEAEGNQKAYLANLIICRFQGHFGRGISIRREDSQIFIGGSILSRGVFILGHKNDDRTVISRFRG